MSYFDGKGNLLDTDFSVSDIRLAGVLGEWMADHPEATTTIQDGAVTPKKTSFMKPVCKILDSVCVLPNAMKVARYANEIETLYFGTYLVASESKGIFAVAVKAGKTYTIIPCADTTNVYFCKSYAVQEPPEKAKAVWTGNDQLLGIMGYSGEGRLCSKKVTAYSDRQKWTRYTPENDGYIVGCWDMCSGAFVYEGASPWDVWEAFLDDSETDYTVTDTPLTNWTVTDSEKLLALSRRVEPDETLQRVLRRGDYYRNLIGSNLTLRCIGDSNTLGASAGEGYGDLLAAKLGLTISNWGAERAAVTDGYGQAVGTGTGAAGFIQTYLETEKPGISTPCVFTIALGSNDWIGNAPLGSHQDSVNVQSFYGCYKKLIEGIRTRYSDAAIILMTPWQQFYNGRHWYESNGRGYSIRDYCLAIHEIAMMTRNCWVLDMLNSPYITELANAEDGVYQDETRLGRKAQILIAHELEKILMQVVMMNGYDYVTLGQG
ncbi:MAG: SGNH/GDSL hydrolase family protein [Oscillospiraceae bacterium]|nr:SGNH/GDSL hydrolase family protein [Oscillospiraceae bacterium]